MSQQHNARRLIAVGLGLLMGLLPMAEAAGAQPVGELTPPALRGIWYPKGDRGAQQCAEVQRQGAGELHAGALQITHTQLIEWGAWGQHTLVFVTESRPRRRHIWRVQGLVGRFPYEAPKVLETYLLELDKNELRWIQRSFDVVAERVDSFVYQRCLP